MAAIQQLIGKLLRSGILVSTDGKDLHFDASPEGVTPALLSEIKANKEALIEWLKAKQEEDHFFLEKAPFAEDHAVSPAQKRIWLLSQDKDASRAYHLTSTFQITGDLDMDAVMKAFQLLVRRHESLRTTFLWTEENGIRQRVADEYPAAAIVRYIDVSADPAPIVMCESWLSAMEGEGFDLENGPLVKAAVIRQTSKQHCLFFSMHHIISDGWSVHILAKQFAEAYSALVSGDDFRFPAPAFTYTDFAFSQNSYCDRPAGKKAKERWLSRLHPAAPEIDLPYISVRPVSKTFNGAKKTRIISNTVIAPLERLAAREGASLFTGLLAIVHLLLYRYSGVTDQLLGTVLAGRELPGLQDEVGCYAETLPLRISFDRQHNFIQLLRLTKERFYEAMQISRYPFDRLVEELGFTRDPSRSPLFDVWVVFHEKGVTGQLEELQLPGATGKRDRRPGGATSKFDLSFSFEAGDDGVVFELEYNTDLFDAVFIENLQRHFEALLIQAQTESSRPVGALSLPAYERQKLVFDRNDTVAAFPAEQTLISLFEKQAEQRGSAVALYYGESSVSWRNLDETANKLANLLIDGYGVGTEDVVALSLNRGAAMIYSILGVMKAGGAYVPIDPECPVERCKYILSDTSARLLITDHALPDDILQEFGDKVVDWRSLTLDRTDGRWPGRRVHPANLAYIIYTSGSSGRPKGVEIEHRGAVNRIHWMHRHYSFTDADVILQKTAYTFDVSVWELFLPLCYGCRMALCGKEAARDPSLIVAACAQYGITTMHFVPSMYDALLSFLRPEHKRSLASLRRIFTSGEALLPQTVQTHHAYFAIPLHNLYGPTEASVDVTYYETRPGDNIIPIGKPIDNISIYILDEELGLVPEGVRGQIAIGGVGVARGYRNNPALTSKKFLADPFKRGGTIYLTGDLGRWGREGNVEYLGRQDDQVKIKGFRVEPGEVENLLLRHPAVTGAAVIARRGEANDNSLLAFYTGEHIPQSTDTFTRHLLQYIPDHMIPARFIWLESLPRTSSGKVNRKELLLCDIPDTIVVSDIPVTTTESRLLEIWKDVLQVNKTGIRENFFLSGGDSIKAIKLMANINKEWNLSMQLRDLYRYPFIQALAAAIEQHHSDEDAGSTAISDAIAALYDSITRSDAYSQAFPSPPEDIYPMSDIQKGIIYYNLLGEGTALYQDQFFYQFRDDAFDHSRLEKAISLLVAKHPMLRTNFHLTTFQEPVLVVHGIDDQRTWTCAEDISRLGKEEKASYLRQLMAGLRKKEFDIREGDLWKIYLFQLDEKEYGILLVFHHAIMDGWSISVFLTELYQIYTALKTMAITSLPRLKTTYKHYIIDQLAAGTDPVTKAFWNTMLEGHPSPSLPFGKSRVNGLKERGTWRYKVDKDLSGAIHGLSAACSVTVKDIFAAALGLTLQFTTGESDIIWGMVTHGRPALEDSEKMLGCFLNSIPFRIRVDPDQTVGQYLAMVGGLLTDVKPYEKLSLNAIVRNLGTAFSLANPLFDVLFNFVDFNLFNALEAQLEVLEPLVASYENNNTLLDFQINRIQGRLEIAVNYQESCFTAGEAARLGEYFVTALRQLTCVPGGLPLRRLSLLSDEQRHIVFDVLNGTSSPLPATTVNELWADVSRRQADRVVLHCDDRRLTYRQLEALSENLATALSIRCHIGKGDTVAVLMERSEWLVIAMLAIWKTGGIYVPVDTAFPAERKRYILEDAGVKIILTDDPEGVAPFGIDAVHPAGFAQLVQENIASLSPVALAAEDAAYIIYTSGSTGKPKGVAVTHRNLVNFMGGMDRALPLDERNHLLAITTVAFDISILELMWTLLRGIGITIRQDAKERTGFTRYRNIDALQATPSFLRLLLADEASGLFIRSLKYIIIGGEMLDASLVELTRKRTDAVLFNVYGPTETTIWSSVKMLAPGMPVTAGRPIINTSIYILDEHGRLLPPDTDGEICIGGNGVASGYINRPELTAEKFVPDMYTPGGGRLYRTGDNGRWTREGEIIVKGRKDRQLKINGYRVEPGEIERALLELPGIEQAVVWKTDEPEGMLAACYVSVPSVHPRQVREQLSGALPVYMIPNKIIPIDAIPLSPGGKADLGAIRQLAAQPVRTAVDEAIAPGPFTGSGKAEVVSKVMEIWKELFPHETPEVNDNFFTMGGNSMLAIRLHDALNAVYPHSIRIADLFDNSTIAAQAVLISEKLGAAYSGDHKDPFELLSL